MTGQKSPTHIIFTIVYSSLAAMTLIPLGIASKPCLLGYKALCSFTPVSTLALLALAGLHVYLHKRPATRRAA